ncbi:MAG: hypothetical protein US02_C0015G0005 [Candidatus Levybacteria bacterium GW2011_GWA2_36_13]|nr:MAG: hypothetical protein US02_C0015G0005 [Candidatus Levybacteria bacterium GW2011_GWA2_36_13]
MQETILLKPSALPIKNPFLEIIFFVYSEQDKSYLQKEETPSTFLRIMDRNL